jgi:hypothetical protein
MRPQIVDEQLARHRERVLNMGLKTQRASRLAFAVREAAESMTPDEIRECVERNVAALGDRHEAGGETDA